MSLLIDALKKAEAARAQAQGSETPAPADSIKLEPMPEPRSAAPQAASSSREANTPTPARDIRSSRPVSAVASSTASSQAARDLFEVKRQAPNRLPMILAAAGVALLLIGAGYVWWAIQPHSSLIAPGLQSDKGASQTPVASIAAPTPIDTAPAVTPPSPSIVDTPVSVTATPTVIAQPVREARPAYQPSPRARVEPSASEEPKPQTRNSTVVTDGNSIQAAYAAFLEGNYALARQRYQDVLRQEPRNVDALNALGMIAWRSGQPDVAERMFRTAVQTDPKDITANAQLALLYAEGDPTAAEGRLRNLIASQPAGAAAYYSLGSLMARQGRWNESQQALFQAYTLDSDNPDILFNLAISLEHLAQLGVAQQFYERALQASSRRPAGFDKSVAQSRIQALRER
ncbi:MAG TPA: tetratricopeptide repeat protein [Rhodocyclaceae bacterium]|nr:tetratricopeptide repeat protein [Rhodocyclaceae bacterium]